MFQNDAKSRCLSIRFKRAGIFLFSVVLLASAACADDTTCTSASQARLAAMTRADAEQFRDLIFSTSSPKVITLWQGGLRIGATGLEVLTPDDFRDVADAKKEFLALIGPSRNIFGFREFSGDPFTSKAADINFIFYFYDSSVLLASNSDPAKRLLESAMDWPEEVATKLLKTLEGAQTHTFLQVHPQSHAIFDRGVALVDLRMARKYGLSRVVFSLLAAATSPALLQSPTVRTEWFGTNYGIEPDKVEAVKNYIAFVYWSGLPAGATEQDVNRRIGELPTTH